MARYRPGRLQSPSIPCIVSPEPAKVGSGDECQRTRTTSRGRRFLTGPIGAACPGRGGSYCDGPIGEGTRTLQSCTAASFSLKQAQRAGGFVEREEREAIASYEGQRSYRVLPRKDWLEKSADGSTVRALATDVCPGAPAGIWTTLGCIVGDGAPWIAQQMASVFPSSLSAGPLPSFGTPA